MTFNGEITKKTKWSVGVMDRGHSHYSYAILDENERVVVECGENKELAFLLAASPQMLALLDDCSDPTGISVKKFRKARTLVTKTSALVYRVKRKEQLHKQRNTKT